MNFRKHRTFNIQHSTSKAVVKASWVLGVGCWMLNVPSVLACSACYGASDSPLAKGMNWGILSLLAVVVCVLGTFATFFVYLAKKSITTPVEPADSSSPDSDSKL